jgi:hypothetical protein
MSEFYQDDDEKLWEKKKGEYVSFEEEFKDIIPELDIVVHYGGGKHGYGSYMDDDNPSLQHKANCASLHRHLAKFTSGINMDDDSGAYHLACIAVRAIMTLKGIKAGLPGREADD